MVTSKSRFLLIKKNGWNCMMVSISSRFHLYYTQTLKTSSNQLMCSIERRAIEWRHKHAADFEKIIRGGIIQAAERYAKAINKYMNDQYSPGETSTWLQYLEANNSFMADNPVNFARFLRTAFLIEHLRWLLLDGGVIKTKMEIKLRHKCLTWSVENLLTWHASHLLNLSQRCIY